MMVNVHRKRPLELRTGASYGSLWQPTVAADNAVG